MKLLDIFQKKHAKKNIPNLRSGDVVRVHETIKEGKKERIQIFEGIIVAIKGGKTLDATFTVRKISLGVGVEKIFPLHSPKIIKIEIIKKIRSKKSKLYYLRDLTQKQIQKRSELAKYVSWEDEKAKKEEKELKKAQKEEAEKKKEAKEKEQETLDKKFEATRGEVAPKEEKKDTNESKEKEKNKKEELKEKDDKKDEKPRK